MSVAIYQVDAFSDVPFRGNPAAVCLLDGPMDGAWMQDVAREMNLSETAFLYPEAPGFRRRWFRPVVEVETGRELSWRSSPAGWMSSQFQIA